MNILNLQANRTIQNVTKEELTCFLEVSCLIKYKIPRYLFIYLFIQLYLFVYLFIQLFIYLFICLIVYFLFVCFCLF